MHKQSAENSAMFAGRCLDEMLLHLGLRFNGTTFSEFAAAYVRMLEFAFHDASTQNEDRALAATWAHVLESLIVPRSAG